MLLPFFKSLTESTVPNPNCSGNRGLAKSENPNFTQVNHLFPTDLSTWDKCTSLCV